MKANEFKKLIEEKTPQKIISLHTRRKIYLTPRQIDQLLELKKEDRTPREHLDEPRKIPLKTKVYTLGLRIRGVLND